MNEKTAEALRAGDADGELEAAAAAISRQDALIEAFVAAAGFAGAHAEWFRFAASFNAGRLCGETYREFMPHFEAAGLDSTELLRHFAVTRMGKGGEAWLCGLRFELDRHPGEDTP